MRKRRLLTVGEIKTDAISIGEVSMKGMGICPVLGLFTQVVREKLVHYRPFYVIEKTTCSCCGELISARLLYRERKGVE